MVSALSFYSDFRLRYNFVHDCDGKKPILGGLFDGFDVFEFLVFCIENLTCFAILGDVFDVFDVF